MNKKERDWLSRLYSLAEAVPFPASGTKSTTISGMSSYAEDMRQFQPAYRKALFAVICDGIEGLYEGDDYENPEQSLSVLEAWVQARKQANWDSKPLYFNVFYQNWLKQQKPEDELSQKRTQRAMHSLAESSDVTAHDLSNGLEPLEDE